MHTVCFTDQAATAFLSSLYESAVRLGDADRVRNANRLQSSQGFKKVKGASSP